MADRCKEIAQVFQLFTGSIVKIEPAFKSYFPCSFPFFNGKTKPYTPTTSSCIMCSNVLTVDLADILLN